MAVQSTSGSAWEEQWEKREDFPAVTELIEHVGQVKRTRLRSHS